MKYDHQSTIQFDGTYGVATSRYNDVFFSNASSIENGLAKLNNRGIVFNKTPINSIKTIKVSFSTFNGATLYCGNSPMSLTYRYELAATNEISINESVSFFTIQNEANESIIDELEICYSCVSIYNEYNLPTITINTDLNTNGVPMGINSKTTYSTGSLSLNNPNNSANNIASARGSFKRRGNSTNMMPKRSYRIKLDKKTSFFGREKAKSWVLLADYMDGSKLHDYAAYRFANMIRENEFSPTSIHVNLILDGVNLGIYLFGEHPDEKAGRLNLEATNYLTATSFDDLNFMLEADSNVVSDEEEILNETYFRVVYSYGGAKYWALKYPEKSDFYTVTDDPTSFNTERYYAFFDYVRNYITTAGEAMANVAVNYAAANDIVDLQSLASYGMVDLFFLESDHADHSFKVYRQAGSKLKFGPVWDYDSVVFGLPYNGGIVDNPYTLGDITKASTSVNFREIFSKYLLATANGRVLYRNLWNSLSLIEREEYHSDILQEWSRITPSVLADTAKWYQNKYYAIFDNIKYVDEYMTRRFAFLDTYFA